ncbi:hypothetical protein C9H80_13025 [Clostridioides difficile]|nr:hypothetical protein [Clostridioides difficile]EGT5137216.1 hypothetical protein [Clostridioides difficile]EGT5283883.1 hypothetical protein [Clostridioides difficile]
MLVYVSGDVAWRYKEVYLYKIKTSIGRENYVKSKFSIPLAFKNHIKTCIKNSYFLYTFLLRT